MQDKRYDFNHEKNTHKPFGPYEKYVKRPLDCVLASTAVVVLSPLMAATAVLVRTKLGSPVLFTQDRPGKDGKIFKLYKFRSMSNAKDENGNLLPDEQRITKFGDALRKTSLDELPELFNIVKGDMAIIGPRPLAVEYLPYYTREEFHRHDVRPGLTGLAQSHGRNLLQWEERFKYDVEYVKHITFINDAKIIINTLKGVFKEEGASVVGTDLMMDFDAYRRDEMKPCEQK